MSFQDRPTLPTDWLTTRQLMDLLDVTQQITITRYIKAGLPAHKVGNRYLFDPVEVEAWIRSRCTTPTPGQTA